MHKSKLKKYKNDKGKQCTWKSCKLTYQAWPFKKYCSIKVVVCDRLKA